MKNSGRAALAVALGFTLAACASTETAFMVPPDCGQANRPTHRGNSPWPVASGRVMSQDCMERIENSRSEQRAD
jgi:hypothetical protein